MHLQQFLRAMLCAALCAPPLLADHGPGTSGGGSNTQSGETLKPGAAAVDLRFDYTEFENVSFNKIYKSAVRGGGFDFIDRSLVTTTSAAVGVTEDLQLGAAWSYYRAQGAGEAEFDAGAVDVSHFNPDGFTDLWLTAKHRVVREAWGKIAVFGGVKLPIGRDRVRNSAGEFVEPSATAGSGSFDAMAGAAYSVWLTDHATLDASLQYTFRTEHERFKVGDRIDAGTAVAYRLSDSVKDFPQVGVFGEVLVRHLFPSEDHGHLDPNSGGTVVFLSPGLRVSPVKDLTITVAPQFPVIQELRGEQLETDFKLTFSISLSF